MAKKKKNTEVVKKNASVIQIDGELSLLQRKLLNGLLYQAYDNLPVKRKHEVSVSLLCELIGFDSTNINYLKESLREMAKTPIEWNILDKNNNEVWEVSTLLAGVKIERGVCYYEYYSGLAEKLYNPDMFALINMEVQRRFNSSYALALYENCYKFKDVKSTGWWAIEDFRRLMGVSNMDYFKAFSRLNDKIIKPAVREINKYSDIEITPHVDKSGRIITHIKFTVQVSSQTSILSVEETDDIIECNAYKELLDRGISKVFARKAILELGEDYVSEKVAIADSYAKEGKIKGTKSGFLVSAIRNDYSETEAMKKEKAKARVKRESLAKSTLEAKREALQEDKKKLQKEFREAFVDNIVVHVEALSSEEREKIEQDFVSRYNLSEITGGDFRKRKWASLLNWGDIREYWNDVRNLEPSTPIEHAYEFEIAKIDKAIEKLG